MCRSESAESAEEEEEEEEEEENGLQRKSQPNLRAHSPRMFLHLCAYVALATLLYNYLKVLLV